MFGWSPAVHYWWDNKYLGAVSLTGCGFAHDRWGHAGRGRGLGSPR